MMALVKFILGCVLLCCPMAVVKYSRCCVLFGCPFMHQVRNGSDVLSQVHPGLCVALLSLYTSDQEL